MGSTAGEFDQILVVVLKEHLPVLLGPAGAIITSLILVAIMAAAMSTADSNLHAMSALLTRDVYGRFVRPGATQAEKTWIGRGVIALTTVLALALVIAGRHSEHNPLSMIVILGLLAIAFATQLLPVTVDMLFLGRGTRAGAIAGMIAGIVVVVTLSPFFPMVAPAVATEVLAGPLAAMRKMIDTGAWGLLANGLVFAAVSLWEKMARPGPGVR